MDIATSSCPSVSTPDDTTPFWSVRHLEVSDLRSWHRVSLDVGPGLIVMSGPNGAGKTSIVEAIAFGLVGVSPRTAREAEAVRTGCTAFHVSLDVDSPSGPQSREIGYQPRVGRRLRIDGVPVRSLGDWRASGSLLVFLPEELRAVKGPPAARRRVVDRLIEGRDPSYIATSTAYGSAVSQRNALLKRIRGGQAGVAGLGPWDRAVVDLGAQISTARRRAVTDLDPLFRTWSERLGGGADARLVWEPSPHALVDVAEDDVGPALSDLIAQNRERDIAAAQTLSGPHRDDVWIGIDDQDLRRTGSQGEQRTAVLALLLACRDLLTREGVPPIVLLDDVLSELDPERRRRLLDAVRDTGQTWVTSADPDAAALAASTGAARVLHVRRGEIDVT